jgi:TPR repeat protein
MLNNCKVGNDDPSRFDSLPPTSNNLYFYPLLFPYFISPHHLCPQAQACSDQAKRFASAGNLAAAADQQAQAISFGHLPSRADLAWILTDGRQGVPKNCQKAFQLVEQGARLKCCHCQGALSRCLAGGFGCAKDPERCRQLARESAAAGSRYGQYMVGWLHHTGWGSGSKNLSEAVIQYQLAAAQVRR